MPALPVLAAVSISVVCSLMLLLASGWAAWNAPKEAAGPLIVLGLLLIAAIVSACSNYLEDLEEDTSTDEEPKVTWTPFVYVGSLVLPIHFGLNSLYLYLGDAIALVAIGTLSWQAIRTSSEEASH